MYIFSNKINEIFHEAHPLTQKNRGDTFKVNWSFHVIPWCLRQQFVLVMHFYGRVNTNNKIFIYRVWIAVEIKPQFEIVSSLYIPQITEWIKYTCWQYTNMIPFSLSWIINLALLLFLSRCDLYSQNDHN